MMPWTTADVTASRTNDRRKVKSGAGDNSSIAPCYSIGWVTIPKRTIPARRTAAMASITAP
jgi:hypothetical protein